MPLGLLPREKVGRGFCAWKTWGGGAPPPPTTGASVQAGGCHGSAKPAAGSPPSPLCPSASPHPPLSPRVCVARAGGEGHSGSSGEQGLEPQLGRAPRPRCPRSPPAGVPAGQGQGSGSGSGKAGRRFPSPRRSPGRGRVRGRAGRGGSGAQGRAGARRGCSPRSSPRSRRSRWNWQGRRGEGRGLRVRPGGSRTAGGRGGGRHCACARPWAPGEPPGRAPGSLVLAPTWVGIQGPAPPWCVISQEGA